MKAITTGCILNSTTIKAIKFTVKGKEYKIEYSSFIFMLTKGQILKFNNNQEVFNIPLNKLKANGIIV